MAIPIVSPHHVWFDLETNKRHYTLTGVFILDDFKGTSSEWYRQSQLLMVPIPDLPNGKGLQIEHYAPYFTMNSIFSKSPNNNVGFAIDGFKFRPLLEGSRSRSYGQDHVAFLVDIAVSGGDSFLLRIGFNITLKGNIKPVYPLPS